MSKTIKLALAFAIGLTGATALAHTGAKGVVKVRMEAMGQIKDGMKTLGTMAKGAIDFDAAQASDAAEIIRQHAADIPVLFKKHEISHPSEASEAIWTDWDGFVRSAEALVAAAETAKQKSGSLKGVQSSIRGLGQACKACHQDYRIAK